MPSGAFMVPSACNFECGAEHSLWAYLGLLFPKIDMANMVDSS